MSAFTIIIPARYGSSRLPGKPLLDIAGKPMIAHVYDRARESLAKRIYVATDDARIAEAVEGFGGSVLMTRADHPSGTDRLAECADTLELDDDEIVVNVQGDEPMLPAELISQVANNLAANPQAGIATLCERIHDRETLFNPNAVKVVKNEAGMALYFSRAPIPWARDYFADADAGLPPTYDFYRHIGIYAYRVGFLRDYVTWGSCPLEGIESLEQLRAMWRGVPIHVDVAAKAPPAGVDTEADLQRVRAVMAKSS
ncbi:3-deoxy-D-manno-octulosonate cytidylyltransferase [Hahella chejuensis KCTC 2396]|uniref:3-deoxy-manno-octulosonate cytidylyltransferase n=1 Tax=Hahella chejuensis (strain KCTC 2396) TaxID=349521 RepID=KDSB_HAHCH|nr:3-deoxy-manno-octulosonate cytidylyltransferase [Hahella chejuensis]Q2SIN2.1 RecName: Full=3-deoxy-manno-octulosonate cytidylyltransferase; AltName: Full=CMP-2-keto-3-deoxyoctulosonic acid synthase; Short=CKS; Short=CMP-KDO synthase [Hahella chejuensis KCTC 2396]ABC29492.1 3-deoxy-D-manno-octulosonate cytidylyltransferase [Hahella chejuensis KCTC 2396]